MGLKYFLLVWTANALGETIKQA